ncbi:YkvA family protein [Alienimonas californiensis]|uniref:DUF1232 domain-containing protein n=1 Tax=Alienimonas californiensis TaxID=2527989 RepID=A0A517P6Q5_9PLAN|nr:DUF1232 domain-containing protein [Alienimonas californiensis]QDT15058.1 hypothetical protein CA12_11380 [Alienimonas californiensis]
MLAPSARLSVPSCRGGDPLPAERPASLDLAPEGDALPERAALRGLLSTRAGAIGRQTVEKALWLYYAALSPNTPAWAKARIAAALAYLMMPLDAVPDALPGVGFADDAAALAWTVAAVAFAIDENVKQRARAKAADWFDPAD